jgi:hypothetical protein
MKALTHRAPVVRPVIIQVNIDITALFWPLFAAVWLGWLAMRRVVRLGRRLYEIIRAVAVVSGRRLRRWLRGNERRFEWAFSGYITCARTWGVSVVEGLVYGPVLGVG